MIPPRTTAVANGYTDVLARQPEHIETLVSGFEFVEAPRVAADGQIVFSDLIGGGLYRRTTDGRIETLIKDRRWIGGVVFQQDGSILASGEGGIVRVDPASGLVRTVLSSLGESPLDAVNDMEADDEGGVYAGSVDFSAILGRGEAGKPGVLFRLDPSGTIEIIREGVAISNGMGFSPDRKVFYHSDCTVGIWAYDYCRGSRPKNPVLFAHLDDSDGLAVDAEGGVWVARWRASQLLRYRPDGVISDLLDLQVPHTVSLSFGEADLEHLYI